MKVFTAYLLIAMGVLLMADAIVKSIDSHCAPCPLPKSMSWDQENLKAQDSREGCIARHGRIIEVDGLYVECM